MNPRTGEPAEAQEEDKSPKKRGRMNPRTGEPIVDDEEQPQKPAEEEAADPDQIEIEGEANDAQI
jgi:hypothetical protein